MTAVLYAAPFLPAIAGAAAAAVFVRWPELPRRRHNSYRSKT